MKRNLCPNCRKPVSTTEDSAWRPFCSERCRLIDLGEWMDGSRRIPYPESVPHAASPHEPEIKH